MSSGGPSPSELPRKGGRAGSFEQGLVLRGAHRADLSPAGTASSLPLTSSLEGSPEKQRRRRRASVLDKVKIRPRFLL